MRKELNLIAPDGGFTPETARGFIEDRYEDVSCAVKLAVRECGCPKQYWEDCFQVGMFNVSEVLYTYDPEKEALLTTFIINVAKWRIIDYLRRNDPVSRSIRRRLKKNPNDPYPRDCSEENYNSTFHALNPPCSLEEFQEKGGDIGGKNMRPVEEEVDLIEKLDVIRKFLASRACSPRDRKIFELHLKGETQKEIGEKVGIGQARVGQILKHLKFIFES